MHASAATLLLLTSCLSTVPKVAAHGGHAHTHLHKRDANIITEWAYVTQIDYVTVAIDLNGNTLSLPSPTALPSHDDAAPSINGEGVNASAAARIPFPAKIPQQAAPAVESEDEHMPVSKSSAHAAPRPSPAVISQEDATPAIQADDIEAPASEPSAETSASLAPVVPHPSTSVPQASTGRFPFSRIVAFGDSLTDNGNGTYAHCTQAGYGDCGNKIYGFGTWTNGPVAVSYLSDKLGVPLAEDYAWGWNHGGGSGDKMAATIKQSFTASPDSQSGFQQVAQYLSADQDDIGKTLQFLWIGNMDISLPKFQYPDNTQWSSEIAGMISQLVGQLIDAGAPYVFVPGLYAKQIAPFHDFMASSPIQQEQMGQAIQQANAAIKSTIEEQYGNRVIYYDVFDRMMNIWNNHDSYGIDMVGDNFCDGDTAHPTNFDVCLMESQGDRWYWINFTDFTTHVHSLIADDMFSVLQKRFS